MTRAQSEANRPASGTHMSTSKSKSGSGVPTTTTTTTTTTATTNENKAKSLLGVQVLAKAKKSRKRRPAQPQPGDPDYKTPTQLRNARKRRKKKQDKAKSVSVSAAPVASEGSGNNRNHNRNNNHNNNHNGESTRDIQLSKSSNNYHNQNHNHNNSQNHNNYHTPKDPSLKYLSNPRAAPTVRNAIKFFREKTNAASGTSHDAYFPVTVGPKLGWRTVARLAVQTVTKETKGNKNKTKNSNTSKTKSTKTNENSNSNNNPTRLRIGLFVPGSHDLLPVPDCPVHHRRINDLVKVLEEECNELGVPAALDSSEHRELGGSENGNEHGSSCGLRYVALAVERSSQKQQLVLVWKEGNNATANGGANGEATANELPLLDSLVQRLVTLSNDPKRKETNLHSIWVHYNNTWKHANSIFDREGRWETRYVCDATSSTRGTNENTNDKSGEETKDKSDDPLHGSIREVMLLPPGGASASADAPADAPIRVPLYFPPQVFRQANLDGFARIIARIREWLLLQQQQHQPQQLQAATPDDPPPRRKRRRGKRDTSNNAQKAASTTTTTTTTTTKTATKTATTAPAAAPAAACTKTHRPGGHCLELYGGVGTIGLNLADLFDSIESSDENPFNERCFHAAADELTLGRGGSSGSSHARKQRLLDPCQRSKITYVSKSATDVVRDRFASLCDASVVIVDPPRKGLDRPVVEALCGEYEYQHHPQQHKQQQQQQQHLIYVSCGFDAFRRDYKALVEDSGRWTLDCAEGHVLFPGSDAIETLAFFTRTK